MVGPSGLEPPTSCLSGTRSNHLSYEPISGVGPVAILFSFPRFLAFSRLRFRNRWWRWWDSNPWPPACRAGALPTELHPHISLWDFALLLQKILQNWTTNCTKAFTPLVWLLTSCLLVSILHRKEVIQPHLPIRLPCYDLTPIIEPTFDHCLLAVSSWASGVPNFHGLTGGVYKARERIHRGMLIRDY